MQRHYTKYIYLSFCIVGSLVFLFLLIINFILTLINPDLLLRLFIFLISSIILGVIITVGISVFNPIFSDAVATLRRILRIESLSNPILVKLSSRAPGTYHHSINVSTLAQKAAKSIGADSLLVRTAAYYHDLGKLENPTQFVENQSGPEIPTADDAESIKKNVKAIIDHVENGARIARENNVPAEVVDLIKEHHGTTKVLYFFAKAKEKGLKIKKTEFSYPGPTPQTKEAAILMLADCAEAIARSLPDINDEQIDLIVDNMIKDRQEEKQFKKSNLSNKELDKIARSLKETLMAIYHQRIEYKNDPNHSAH